ncbi:MAG: hypothetical protein VST71_09665 [Nitrospirota bacterium]|nr:hypothetical protein [Nitrospirota bacterium]
MRKTWFNIFIGLFVLLFAGLWIVGGVAEARSKEMKREHHKYHYSGVSYNVGGIVSGLADGETVVLQNNGGDDLEITANGDFTFSTTFADGETYDVTVLTQPDSQICSVNNSSGTINGADIIDITVTCSIVSVAAGDAHTVALRTDGTVWAWGDNRSGQLGDGTTLDSITPVQVNGLAEVAVVAAGIYHTIALKTDGTVWAWGSNYTGQLGDGTKTDSSTPVQVIDLTNVTAIATKSFHTIALKSDGTIWTWGSNNYGQLGDGPTIYSIMPVQVNELTDVAAIAVGGEHTVALKSDGTVWAWGRNDYGQLGSETTERCELGPTCSITPLQVTGLTDVAAIAGGGSHTIALKKDGTVWAWGSNIFDQLGVTTSEACVDNPRYYAPCSTTPIQVFDLTTSPMPVTP